MKLIIDIDESLLNEAKNGHICLGEFADAVMNGVPYTEKPQGEWIHLHAIGDYKCSICGAENLYKYANEHERWVKTNSNYCPNCGAKMQKAGAE